MKPLDIIKKYYPESSDAYRILVTHSRSVADKALALARLHPEMNLDLTFIEEAAMLHDIGIFLCNAPDTFLPKPFMACLKVFTMVGNVLIRLIMPPAATAPAPIYLT